MCFFFLGPSVFLDLDDENKKAGVSTYFVCFCTLLRVKIFGWSLVFLTLLFIFGFFFSFFFFVLFFGFVLFSRPFRCFLFLYLCLILLKCE